MIICYNLDLKKRGKTIDKQWFSQTQEFGSGQRGVIPSTSQTAKSLHYLLVVGTTHIGRVSAQKWSDNCYDTHLYKLYLHICI
jgi:hypothetical protein